MTASEVTAIVQARMSSRRLPNKVLLEVGGKPLIQYLLESLRQSRVRDIIVATSIDASDDVIESFCRRIDVKCHRGSLKNVAKRFVETIDAFGLNAFVRVNGDSPLLDYRLVDKALSLYCTRQYDVVTNVLKRSFPKGQSVEVVKSSSFKKAYPLMKENSDREHVTKYFYSHTDDFAIHNFEATENYSAIQLSVDGPKDMERFKAIITMMTRPHWEYQFTRIVNLAHSYENVQSE